MKKEEFIFKDSDNMELYGYKWSPDSPITTRAIVQIVHGMAETAARYQRFAEDLSREGILVYANDQRGHGRTAKSVDNLGYAGKDGFNWMVKDIYELNEFIRSENDNIPIFLIGHSMGSLLAQRYISMYGNTLKGVILSGTSGNQGIMLDIGILSARREMNRIGEKAKSQKLNDLTFGNYNKSFKPTRTEFDWLSRDYKEVDKYINDEFCGTIFTAGFFYDLFMGLKENYKLENMRNIPQNLPVYIFSGEEDPVGRNCKSVYQLIKSYQRIGIKDVTYKFYKGGRHEMLNEINRDEVIKDVIKWLDAHM